MGTRHAVKGDGPKPSSETPLVRRPDAQWHTSEKPQTPCPLQQSSVGPLS